MNPHQCTHPGCTMVNGAGKSYRGLLCGPHRVAKRRANAREISNLDFEARLLDEESAKKIQHAELLKEKQEKLDESREQLIKATAIEAMYSPKKRTTNDANLSERNTLSEKMRKLEEGLKRAATGGSEQKEVPLNDRREQQAAEKQQQADDASLKVQRKLFDEALEEAERKEAERKKLATNDALRAELEKFTQGVAARREKEEREKQEKAERKKQKVIDRLKRKSNKSSRKSKADSPGKSKADSPGKPKATDATDAGRKPEKIKSIYPRVDVPGASRKKKISKSPEDGKSKSPHGSKYPEDGRLTAAEEKEVDEVYNKEDTEADNIAEGIKKFDLTVDGMEVEQK